MKKAQVYVCVSIYNLYVSMLHAIENKKKGIPSRLIYFNLDAAFDSYHTAIQNCSYFEQVIAVPDLRNRRIKGLGAILKNIFFYRREVNQYFRQETCQADIDRLMKEAEINVFSTTLLFQKFLFFNYPKHYFRILEDGLLVYREIHNPITRIIKFIHSVPDRPSDALFREICVAHPEKLPARVQSKAQKLTSDTLVKTLNSQEKQELTDFFLKDFAPDTEHSKSLLIITQPLSEDHFVSEEYKLDLYKKIADDYHKKGYQIYLKMHPRETSNYSLVLPADGKIIPASFPLEILNLHPSLTFEKGITLFSSALNNCDFIEEKLFLGEQWDSKIFAELQKRFKIAK